MSQALRANVGGSDNTATGVLALGFANTGSANTANGSRALYANTSGNWNTATGFLALHDNNVGVSNTANGAGALYGNINGSQNVGVGAFTLFSNLSGDGNTATGYLALHGNTKGNSNTAVGVEAMYSNLTGTDNTAIGHSTLRANSIGTSNVAFGNRALFKNVSGSFNVAIGDGALGNSADTTLNPNDGNIALGLDAGANLTVGDNNIYLGNPGSDLAGTAISTESGMIRIGTKATHTDTYIAGVIHGDGSQLTGVRAAIASGSITSSQLGTSLTVAGDSSNFGLTVNAAGGFGGVLSNGGTNGYGVKGTTTSAIGLWGNSIGAGDGVYGSSSSGVGGHFLGGPGSYGVSATGGVGGVRGTGTSGYGVDGQTTTGIGVYGHSIGAGDGVYGTSAGGKGVYGRAVMANATTAGVWGENIASRGTGVVGRGLANDSAGVSGIADLAPNGAALTNTTGVYGRGTQWAGSFDGNLRVSADETLYGKEYFGNTTRQMLNLFDTSFGIGVQAATFYCRCDVGSGFAWYSGGSEAPGVEDPGVGLNGSKLMTLHASSNPARQGKLSIGVLQITGGADLAEPFEMKEEELEKGSVVVIDEEHPGRLKRSNQRYDTRVAGIVSGANGINPGIALRQEGTLEGGQNVALSGRVYVLADASSGPIQPGDMLTTSETPGHAMKATDHERAHGAIIGKAMSPLNEGTGTVLVLVTLQ